MPRRHGCGVRRQAKRDAALATGGTSAASADYCWQGKRRRASLAAALHSDFVNSRGQFPWRLTPCSPTMNLPGCGPLPALSPRYGEENSPDDSLRRAPLNQFQPGRARQRLGVRWVRGEGTHRFPFDPRGDLRKRCQPSSPPATALQNLAAIRTVQGQGGRRSRGRVGRFMGSQPHPLRSRPTDSSTQPLRRGPER